MKKVLLALFACLALVACLLVLAEYPLNVDFMRGTLEHELESKLGCRVAIDGPIQVAIGFKPTFWLNNMSLAKLTSSGDGPLLARIRMVKGKVDLLPLLKGAVRLGLLEIRKIEAHLHVSHDQLVSLMRQSVLSPQSANKPSTLFEIRRFSLENLLIMRSTPTGGDAQVWLALDRVTGTLPLDAHLKLKAEGRYHDAPFSFEASGKSLRAWGERTKPWPLKISFHTDKGQIHCETAIKPPKNGADLKGIFTLTCFNTESLGLFFGAHLPELGTLDLKGRYEAISDGVNLADLTGQVAVMGGSIFSGELRIQTHPAGLKVEGRLESNKFNIEKLGHLFDKAYSWRGIIDSMRFTGASHGASPRDFLANLTGEVRLGNASLFVGDERSSSPIFLDSLIAGLDTGQHLSCSVSGRWREEPFAIAFASGPIKAYFHGENIPIRITAHSFEAKVEGQGSIGPFTDTAGLSLNFKLTGKALESLRPWLNISPQGNFSYLLDGRLMATSQYLSLTQLTGKIGRSEIAGELVWRGFRTAPRLSAKLYSQTLHWEELSSLTRALRTQRVEQNGQRSNAYAVLKGMPFTDFELEIGQILGIEQDLSNLTARGHMRAGALKTSVSGDLGGSEFAGNLEAEIIAEAILARMHLSSHEVNISELLQRTGIDQDLDLSARFLEIEGNSQGRTLETLVNRLSTTIRLKDGVIRRRTPDTTGHNSLVISQAQVRVPADSQVTATAEVLIDKKPAKLQLRSDLGVKDRVPFDLEARMADARLSLRGAVTKPWSRPRVTLSFQLAGQNLHSLSFASDPEMPALGPYAVAGNLSATPKHYNLTGVDLRVGTSHLTGNMEFGAETKRPRFKGTLSARTLQLDDFTPSRQSFNNAAGTNSTRMRQARPDNATGTMKNLEHWLRQLMGRVDVDLQLEATEVLSGTNRLGSGKVALTVRDGRLSLDELTGGVFGGEINLGLVLEKAGRNLKMETWGKVRNLDYLVLARLMKPQAMQGGNLSLDFRFTGVTPSLADFLAYANGHFHGVVQPRRLEKADSGYWFVDFVFGVIPLLELGPAPHVNCIVGNVNLKDGLAPGATLLIDLTDEQIKGAGTINMKTRTLNLVFHPEPKKLVFKIPLPVRVSGNFADYRFTPTHRKFLVTLSHYVTHPIKHLISLLFHGTAINPCTVK